MTPTTEAGRALLTWADELRPFLSEERVLSPSSVARVEDGIDAIEAEAAAAERPRDIVLLVACAIVIGACLIAGGVRP